MEGLIMEAVETKHRFSIDSDPWQGGHNNNLKVVEKYLQGTIIDQGFAGFGVTSITFTSPMTHDEIWDKFEDLYQRGIIRGAAR